MRGRRVRVLIVDDSAVARKALSMGLSVDPRLEVVGMASNAGVAGAMLRDLRPDVVTLDMEMPGVDGLTFLRSYMTHHPVPTVVISAHTRHGAALTLQAMEAGAVDIIAKPSLAPGHGLHGLMAELRERVTAAAGARLIQTYMPRRDRPAPLPPMIDRRNAANWVHAIGASTGGVQALCRILPMLPADCSGVVIVQHMPEGFTATFAQRLDEMSAIQVREARDGDVVQPGLALLAPGGTRHMTLVRAAGGFCVALNSGAPVCFSRPSVDVLFHSVARATRGACSAALLTGMGRDGAEGMLAIRQAGGTTIAQDEATSVVNGMPQAAWDLGGCDLRVPLDEIPAVLLQAPHAPRPTDSQRPEARPTP